MRLCSFSSTATGDEGKTLLVTKFALICKLPPCYNLILLRGEILNGPELPGLNINARPYQCP